MKRHAVTFVAGALVAFALALHQGPERIIQFGMKYAAFTATYEWASSPRMQMADSQPATVRAPRAR